MFGGGRGWGRGRVWVGRVRSGICGRSGWGGARGNSWWD